MSGRCGWCTAPPGIKPTHDCRYDACTCTHDDDSEGAA